MHSHVLFFFSLSAPKYLFYCVSFFLLSSLISLIWHLGSLFLQRTRYLVMVLHLLLLFLLFPFETGYVIQNPKRILMRTSVTGVDTRGESPPSFSMVQEPYIYSIIFEEGPLILLLKYGFRVQVCSWEGVRHPRSPNPKVDLLSLCLIS